MQAILLSSIDDINQLTAWGIGLIAGMLIIRAANDFMNAMSDPETGIKDALRKVRKRIIAAVIAVTIEGTIIFLQGFWS